MAAPTPPKGMSSRLLTMKFMQRASASSPASSPSTPKSEEQSSKRRKVSNSPSVSIDVDSLVDRQAIQAAIHEGEKRRQDAIVKQAAELGDARWVLDVPQKTSGSVGQVRAPLNVVQVGFAQIDSSDASENHTGSQAFRRYNMETKKAAAEARESDDESGSGSDSSEERECPENSSRRQSHNKSPSTASGNERRSTSRSGCQSKKSAEFAKAKELAEKRRKKEVKLNNSKNSTAGGLMSLSSGGGKLQTLSSGGSSMTQRQSGPLKCHGCGKLGHKAADCKNNTK